MSKNNDASNFPTIPNKSKQREFLILGKYSKQPFHDSNSKACIKLELIHFDFCGPMHVVYENGNKYLMIFNDDYIRMCWFYSLKQKSKAFETFKNFHIWIENEAEFVPCVLLGSPQDAPICTQGINAR